MKTEGETVHIQTVTITRKPVVISGNDDKKKKIRAIKEYVLTDARIKMGDVRVDVSENRGGYQLRTAQVPLDLYFRSKMLGKNEEEAGIRYAAGTKFYRDFYIAGLTMKMTIDFNSIYSGESRHFLPVSDIQRDALDRWRKAYDAVSGSIGKMMAVNVCCYGYYLKDIEHRYYKRGADAMPRLLEVLDDLAMHYFY